MIQYQYADCVTFYRSGDEFGGLSNMCGGYPIVLGPHSCRSTEHLYQAMRFPDHPALQADILATASPVMAKRLAHRHLDATRPDWMTIRPDVMAWCLALKWTHNPDRFGTLLLSTGKR